MWPLNEKECFFWLMIRTTAVIRGQKKTRQDEVIATKIYCLIKNWFTVMNIHFSKAYWSFPFYVFCSFHYQQQYIYWACLWAIWWVSSNKLVLLTTRRQLMCSTRIFSLLCCVFVFLVFVLCPVPNVSNFSYLCFLDCPFDFL